MTLSEDKSNKEIKSAALGVAQEFTVSSLHFVRHVLALVITILLFFSLVMSEVTRFSHGKHVSLISQTTPLYLLLLMFSVVMTVKAIISVNKVRVGDKGIEISNLFWHETRYWEELRCLRAPKNLTFAWLKTRLSFYLFVKREFKNYAEIEAAIGHYLAIDRS